MTTRIVQNTQDFDRLLRLLKTQDWPLTVTVTKGKHRTDRQNKLQRKWVAEVAEQMGDRTAEEVRGYCKLHIGVPLLRDENEAFRLKYDAILKPLPYEQKLALMMEPISLPVTSIMNTKQKHEYLERVYRHFTEQGVELTIPQDGLPWHRDQEAA